MIKTFIVVSGGAKTGKSTTIKKLGKFMLLSPKNGNKQDLLAPNNNPKADILWIVTTASCLKVGIESQGDPNSRILGQNSTLFQLTAANCDIIVCACRTGGLTKKTVHNIATTNGYRIIELGTYYSSCNVDLLNELGSKYILSLIDEIEAGRL